MDQHQYSTSDFRYLNLGAPCERFCIERELIAMGTSPEVVQWFFAKFDEQAAEYTKELNYLNFLLDPKSKTIQS